MPLVCQNRRGITGNRGLRWERFQQPQRGRICRRGPGHPTSLVERRSSRAVPRPSDALRGHPTTTNKRTSPPLVNSKNPAHQDPGKTQGKKTHAGRRGPWRVIAGQRGLRVKLVGVWVRTGAGRENSDLRKFLFGGVELRSRMSHTFAPHVPLGVIFRVGLEGIAAARASPTLTAPVPERPSARTTTRAVRPRRSPLERAPNDQCPTHGYHCHATENPSSDLHARHRSVDRWLVHHLAQFAT